MISWLEKKMTHSEGKFIFTERFIRNLNNKVYVFNI